MNKMTDEQRAYHELETMQEFGYLLDDTNICEILDEYVELKKDQQELPETESVELENHMVIGEYYDDSNSGDEDNE